MKSKKEKKYNLVLKLDHDSTKSRVYYRGVEMAEVSKVEVVATPEYTHIVLHCIEAEIISDFEDLEITTLKR